MVLSHVVCDLVVLWRFLLPPSFVLFAPFLDRFSGWLPSVGVPVITADFVHQWNRAVLSRVQYVLVDCVSYRLSRVCLV